ncbi:MAG TPA: type I secretion system permease/ATPase [Candidatus Cybelea sp.]|nr:type I secretion system permease/ATPase [Candidatus Cybelea sp.]
MTPRERILGQRAGAATQAPQSAPAKPQSAATVAGAQKARAPAQKQEPRIVTPHAKPDRPAMPPVRLLQVGPRDKVPESVAHVAKTARQANGQAKAAWLGWLRRRRFEPEPPPADEPSSALKRLDKVMGAAKRSPAIDPMPAPQTEPKPEPKLEQESTLSPPPKAELSPAPKAEAKPEPKLKPEPEPKLEQTPAPTPAPKAELSPAPKAEAKPEPKPEPEPEPKLEQKPAPTPASKAEPAHAPKAEAKPEPKSEPKPEAKLEQKSEPAPEPKPKRATEPKPDTASAPRHKIAAASAEPRGQPEPLRGPNPISGLKRELAGGFLAATVITLFVNVSMLFVPLYDMILYDRVLQSRNMDTIATLTIGCMVGMALYGIVEFFRSSIFVVLADRMARRLNIPTLQAALGKSLAGGASASQQAMRDLNELRMFMSGIAAVVPLDALWTPALVAVLFLLHPAYGIYGLICAAVLLGLSALTDRSTRKDLIQANAAAAASVNDLSAALRNTELLAGLGMLPDVARRWMHRQSDVLNVLGRATWRNKLLGAIAKSARLGMQAGVMVIGVVLVMRYEASPGSMMGANLLVAKLLLPFEQLIGAWRQWTSAIAAWNRVRELLDGRVDAGRAAPAAVTGQLSVDRLCFTAGEGGRKILDDVSFTIEPGEAVGVVGPSGSGKSTLARLIVGVLRPTSGAVCLGNVSTLEWDREAFGQKVGYLPQSISMLDGNIVDNIARMRDADPAAAVEAAERAGVHELIGRLPDGYMTRIGSSEYNLSGGQTQRVALARALYGRPRLLILDEPNANLDHDGEQALLRAIEEAKRDGAAILLITHRPAALAAMDRVVVLKTGRIERIVRPERSVVVRPADAPASAPTAGQLVTA